MGKVRVYELAKELGINSKKLISILQEMDVNVKNHMSTMEEEVAQKITKQLTTGAIKPVTEEHAGVDAPTEAAKEEAPKQDKGAEKKKKTDKRARPAKESRKARKAARNAASKTGQQEELLQLEGRVTVGELAGRLNVSASEILAKLLEIGIIANINQQLGEDILEILAEEYGIKFSIIPDPDEEELLTIMQEEEKEENALKTRPPVVTVLGHVDHGKTSLLDAIRETKVMDSEAGGITQHIGAYVAEINGKKVAFLDTPGHEAFTAMRARGAQATDIVVLVVAAEDGVMPQTIEAINHTKAAGVPIIVAINKIDKPSANPDRVKQQLSEVGLVPEEWGGDTICVQVSAKKKEGLAELLEMILLVAEMAELKANYSRLAKGTVIEAELDKGRGPVATLLIQDGVMHVGEPIICGNIYGKIRAMLDQQGKRIKKATPSTPVEILGLTEVPQAGDTFIVVKDEKMARQIALKRGEKIKEASRQKIQKVSLDDLFNQAQEEEVELNIIIKADVQGSAEALHESLEKIETEQVKIKILHKGVGAITESDVMLASASNAIIVGFNVRTEPNARKLAEKEQVDIRLYRVIYEVLDNVRAALKGMLKPEYAEEIQGQAEVRQLFKVSRVGTIAGCYVQEGKITRNSTIRVIREGNIVHEGGIDSLKRYKDDAKEVVSGFECGILLEKFNNFKEGDILEAYIMKEILPS